MRMIGPRPQISVIPTIRSARPPREYLELLAQAEEEFQETIRQVESNPLFGELIREGYLRKQRFQGRIPRHLYEEFQDRQFIEFLREYDIESKASWQQDFFREDARRHAKELAVKYQVPRGRLIHALEYCRYLRRSWAGQDMDFSSALRLDDPEIREPILPQQSLNSGEVLEELSQQIHDYEITQQEFSEYFLSSQYEPEEVVEELGIPLVVVKEICELVERVQIYSSTQVKVSEAPAPVHRESLQTVARVERLTEPPRAEICVDPSVEYNSRYVFQSHDSPPSSEAGKLLELLRLINQRKSLTFRVVMFIFEYQYRFFVSGNELHLRPLNQAGISRELGEHESSISRVLPGKLLDIPEGSRPLKAFCQSKGDVIQRLLTLREPDELGSGRRSKPFSDAEIAEILAKEYDAPISRRTVTYYRNKVGTVPKLYVRQQHQTQKPCPEK